MDNPHIPDCLGLGFSTTDAALHNRAAKTTRIVAIKADSVCLILRDDCDLPLLGFGSKPISAKVPRARDALPPDLRNQHTDINILAQNNLHPVVAVLLHRDAGNI